MNPKQINLSLAESEGYFQCTTIWLDYSILGVLKFDLSINIEGLTEEYLEELSNMRRNIPGMKTYLKTNENDKQCNPHKARIFHAYIVDELLI
jgi:hypothetical protein